MSVVITMKRSLRSIIYISAAIIVLTAATAILLSGRDMRGEPVAVKPVAREIPEITLDEFGFQKGLYHIERGIVAARQTLSHILSRFDLRPVEIDRIAREMTDVFSPRRIRSGNNYYAYYGRNDSLPGLKYFVYEISDLDYLVVDLSDSIVVSRHEKEVTQQMKTATGVIYSSLWNTLVDNEIHPQLVFHLSSILAWTVDFYRIEKGDRFKVLFAENYVGDRSVGVSHVDAVYFYHRGREVEGYRFEADTILGYFDPEGNNLRKVFLRAPLEFFRISSRYSQSRLHPIHGDRRPHLGTDYAAPHGTPILAVGDGVVTRASYTSGNGNYVRIRHNSVYETQYLHMSRFATGIRPGTRVSQGDVIGYVGSTGLATGPHVCFRFWKNGQQVDHLRLEFPSGDPLPEEYMNDFIRLRNEMKVKLDGLHFPGDPMPV